MKKGFTLIELLAVIIILGVIALITFPVIDNSIKKSKEEALQRTIDAIRQASYEYSVNNDIGYPSIDAPSSLSLDDLKSAGFIEKDLINPVTDKKMGGCIWYYYDEGSKQYNFQYDEECSGPLIPPNIAITYDKSLLTNGWLKANMLVNIVSNGDSIKYCLSDKDCEPSIEEKIPTYSVGISNEGTNVLCAIASNELGTTDKICETLKLDKTPPVVGTATFTGTLGSNNWYTSDVTVNIVNGTDGLSGHLNTTSNIQRITTNTSGTTITITTTDLAGNSSSKNYVIKLDKTVPTKPMLTGGSTTWSNSAKTIKVSTASTSTSGIKNYQYYISTSNTTQTGGSWNDLGSGVTSIDINTSGIRYIYFRSINNAGNISEISSAQVTKIDTTQPTIVANGDYYSVNGGCGYYPILNYFTITNNYNSELSGGSVTCSTDNGQYTEVGGLPRGDNTVTCTIVTGAGNKSSATTVINNLGLPCN